MKNNGRSTDGTALVEAIRAWHRGYTLTQAQTDLIDQARRDLLSRAFGLGIGPTEKAI